MAASCLADIAVQHYRLTGALHNCKNCRPDTPSWRGSRETAGSQGPCKAAQEAIRAPNQTVIREWVGRMPMAVASPNWCY